MLIATGRTAYRLDGAGEGKEPEQVLRPNGVRRLAEGLTLDAVALEDGDVMVLQDGVVRRLRTGLSDEIHSLLLLREGPVELLIGTEPPYVYRLIEGEGAAERIETFAGLKCRDGWHTPWGGPAAVRSMAHTGDGWVYADIHVGSIMRSPDSGATWEPVTPQLHEDVHQVAVCPASDGRVYAQTANAFWLSEDRGESWSHRAVDLGERYGRCVTVHPDEPDLVLATVSDGPHGGNAHGQLYRSDDAGRNWAHVANGFPASTADNIDTFHVAFSAEGVAWACLGRDLYLGRERATQWEPVWQAPEEITMLSTRRP